MITIILTLIIDNAFNVSCVYNIASLVKCHKLSNLILISVLWYKILGFNPWVRKIPWRRKWQPTPVFLPGESYAQRSLVSYIVHRVAQGRTQLK